MQRRCLLLTALALPFVPYARAATDLRLQLNPALAKLYAEDPERAEAVLRALDSILRGEPLPEDPDAPKTRGLNNEEALQNLLEHNPLLQEAWRIDPKAALTQIKEIVAIGGN